MGTKASKGGKGTSADKSRPATSANSPRPKAKKPKAKRPPHPPRPEGEEPVLRGDGTPFPSKVAPGVHQQLARRGEPPRRKMTDAERCTAKSRVTGERCKQKSIPGGIVCRYHGGNLPTVKNAAKLKLAELVMPAIGTLAKEMVSAEKSTDRIRAANSILDRGGVGREKGSDMEEARALLLARLLDQAAKTVAGDLPEMTVETEDA